MAPGGRRSHGIGIAVPSTTKGQASGVSGRAHHFDVSLNGLGEKLVMGPNLLVLHSKACAYQKRVYKRAVARLRSLERRLKRELRALQSEQAPR